MLFTQADWRMCLAVFVIYVHIMGVCMQVLGSMHLAAYDGQPIVIVQVSKEVFYK